ncbi:hypothetical protein ACQY0O_003985 [Thecaphora frezii]
MAGSAPPFHVPGHEWDPIKKRFFKSNPSASSSNPSSSSGASASRSSSSRSSVRHACSSRKSASAAATQAQRRRREEADKAQLALRQRLGIVSGPNLHASVAALKSARRLTFQEASRLSYPAREIASRLSLRRSVAAISSFAGVENSIDEIVHGLEPGILFISSASEVQRIDLLPPQRRESEWAPQWRPGIQPQGVPRDYSLNGRTNVAGRTGTMIHVATTGRGVDFLWRTKKASSLAGVPWEYEFRTYSSKIKGDLLCSALWEGKGQGEDGKVRHVCGVGTHVLVCQGSTIGGLQEFRGKSDVMCVCFASETRIFVGQRSGRVVQLDVPSDQRPGAKVYRLDEVIEEVAHEEGSVTNVTSVSDAEVVVAWTTGKLLLLDVATRQIKRSFEGHVNSYTFDLKLAIDVDRRLLALSGQDGKARVWSLDEPRPLGGPDCGREQEDGMYEKGRPLSQTTWSDRAGQVQAMLWTSRYDDAVVASQHVLATGNAPDGDVSRRGPPALLIAAGGRLFYYE